MSKKQSPVIIEITGLFHIVVGVELWDLEKSLTQLRFVDFQIGYIHT